MLCPDAYLGGLIWLEGDPSDPIKRMIFFVRRRIPEVLLPGSHTKSGTSGFYRTMALAIVLYRRLQVSRVAVWPVHSRLMMSVVSSKVDYCAALASGLMSGAGGPVLAGTGT
jgi:hypothetical protein